MGDGPVVEAMSEAFDTCGRSSVGETVRGLELRRLDRETRMAPAEAALTQGMTTPQRQRFRIETSHVRKSETAGFFLALLLGGLGVHQFYLGRMKMGLRYLAFCWTLIPAIVSIFEAVFMPARIRAYNEERAKKIAAYILFSGEPD